MREQVLASLHGRSAAIAEGFAAGQVATEPRTTIRNAQLAGFGTEPAGNTTRPPVFGPSTSGTSPRLASGNRPAESSADTSANVAAGSVASASILTASRWDNSDMRLTALLCLVLVALAIVAAISILRSLNRFSDAAYETVLGRVGDNALISRNGVRELSGVARLLDRMVFDLRYLSDQMRLTAAENAHSMRTPLATMRTAMSAIRRTLPADEPRAQRALKIIDISLDRLSQVVDSAQRNDMGMANLVAAPRTLVDLTELTRGVIGDVGESLQARNILLRSRLQDGIIVHVGAVPLKAALADVLTSAINVSPSYGEIGVLLECDGMEARLEIEDRGSDDDAPELFFQHDFTPTSETAAAPTSDESRQGLWSVKRTVEVFGGRVAARRNQHGGVSVSIVVPADRS